ncbi:hypothetical protein LCGC14_1544150 [marine sediment metagenome]|uniref:Uncharacterized protein n=1 Tax=marine sediment metagenome TaxID=412755 RepID=A0A0F9IS80_9ZZZZ
MSKYYKNLMLGATRIHSIENIKAWIKAEENLGLHKSIFITIDGVTIQYYDVDEGENFFEWVKKICSNGVIENWFRR